MRDSRSRAFLSGSGRRELGYGCTGPSDLVSCPRIRGGDVCRRHNMTPPSTWGRFKVLIFVLVGSLIVLNMLLGNLQRGSKSGAKESNFSGDRKMRCSCSVEAVHSCTQGKTNTWKMYCISRALPQHCHCICGSSLGWLAFWWKLSRRWPPWSMSRSEWTWPRQCTSQI